ncbi:SPX domain-containing protein 4-like [Solanum dulcamara]|uniref:SPX domain-containing protein 4-like n=1 Tax=Solanum dulcamara TaxID=45834 RepID=UPI0024852EEF|nr:SPX domain-containing protein 4-like [Solanum dulcamara]XP_055806651.1 SPX domain-containing protein 4-like [Solanum dulcamara]
MKFGKEFTTHLEETLPEWRDKYLCYKPLKKLLKHLPSTGDNLPDGGENPPAPLPPPPHLQDWFVRILNEELDKFNDFYVDKEEEFIIRLQELKERIERVKEKSGKDGVLTKDSEFSDEVMGIRKDFVAIHGEMVLLKNYSSLNFAGLVKILKKFDKRTGRLLRLPFTQLALDQPFFTTEPLNRLVRECEENLELLFPLEAEVVESDATAGGTTSYASNVSLALPLGEDNVDIYRSTLAAIKAIQGLKKASSTYNPLSFSYIFGNQDNDSTGAITAENSDSDQLVASQSDKDTGQEDSHPPE